MVLSPPLLGEIKWADRAFTEQVPDPVFERRLKKAGGMLEASQRHMLGVPWLNEAIGGLWLWHSPRLTPDQEGLINLVVAQDNSCRHCYGATRALMRLTGYSEDAVRKLETDIHTAPVPERDRAALDFARKVSRGVPRAGRADLDAVLAAGWSREDAVDIATTACLAVVGARMATLLAIQPALKMERLPGTFLGWVMSPVIRAMLRKRTTAWAFPPLAGGDPPAVATLLAAMGTSTARPLVRSVMHLALGPSHLPPRSKGLIMTVVGAGLECPACDAAGRDLLGANGFSAQEIDTIVSHLGSPRLDDFEGRVLRFARETVRYRAEAVQARCAEFYAGLGRETILECVGMCAVANALGRLSILADR